MPSIACSARAGVFTFLCVNVREEGICVCMCASVCACVHVRMQMHVCRGSCKNKGISKQHQQQTLNTALTINATDTTGDTSCF